MDHAAALDRNHAAERSIVVAAEQTAGRGRSGRQWAAPANSSLFCTAILRPVIAPLRLATLPLVVGVAAAEALEQLTGTTVRLKWPNDIWIGADPDRQKTGGILVTSRLVGSSVDSVLVGIGVNLSTARDALPAGATSILAATGRHVTSHELLRQLLPRLDAWYAIWLAADGRPALDAWRSRAALLGEMVSLIEGDREFFGEFAGIDNEGALLLREEAQRIEPGVSFERGGYPGKQEPSCVTIGGLRRFMAGDLVRGPRRIG